MCVVRSGEDRSGSGRLGLRGGHLEASEVKQNLTMTLIQRGGLQLRPQPHSSASVFYLLPLLTVPVLLLLFWGSGASEWRIFQEIQRASQISYLSSNSQSWGCLLWKPEHTGSWGMIYKNAGTGRPSVPWSQLFCSCGPRAGRGEKGGQGLPLHFVFGLGEMAPEWEKARSLPLWPQEPLSCVTRLCSRTCASRDECHPLSGPLGSMRRPHLIELF